MKPGSIVILHLVNPSEKYWGKLEELAPVGVTLRGLALASFDDWLRDLTSGDPPSIVLATIFFPLHRVERMFLDQPEGPVESLAQRCEQRLKRSIAGVFRTPRSAGKRPSARSHRWRAEWRAQE